MPKGRRLLGSFSLIAFGTASISVGAFARPTTYPGSNGKIAYIRNDAPLSSSGSKPCIDDDIWIMNPDGSSQRNITDYESIDGNFALGDPAWSPDGKTLAFLLVTKEDVADTGNLDGLYLTTYDLVADTLKWAFVGISLPDHAAYDAAAFCHEPYGPAWHPNGKKLAIQSYYGTATIDLSKDNKITYTDPPVITPHLSWAATEPTWAYDTTASGETQIITMPAGGGDAKPISYSSVPEGDPACPELRYGYCDLHHLSRPEWSPDGKTIMVATGLSGFSENGRIGFLDACKKQPLRVIEPNTRGQRMYRYYQPAWSPDGSQIVFSDSAWVADAEVSGGQRELKDIWVMNADGTDVQNLTNTENDIFESAPDWQPVIPEDPGKGCEKRGGLPIIFVPGFLGSDIECEVPGLGKSEMWPALPKPDFAGMALTEDGLSNNQNDFCSRSAGPSGKIVDEGYGYKNVVEFLDDLPRQVYFYGYDWRKSPLLAVPGLDAKVDKALAKAKTDKVVLMAHSMGGLVSRAYVDAHPDKVDRVVTIGTPFLGAPKPWFALAHGWTSPESNSLDKIIPNGALKKFARNATGAYFLYPSEQLVSLLEGWLMYPPLSPDPLNAQQVLDAIDIFNGNSALLEQAYASHSSLLEVYPTNGVQWQMVVGTGVETVVRIDESDPSNPSYSIGNGDGTVPIESAGMGNIQPSAVHYVCGAEHGSMAGMRQVTKIIKAYLLKGDPIVGGQVCPVD